MGKGGKETVRGEVKVFLVWRVCACGMNRMKDYIEWKENKTLFFFLFSICSYYFARGCMFDVLDLVLSVFVLVVSCLRRTFPVTVVSVKRFVVLLNCI